MGTRKNLKPIRAFIDVLRAHLPKIEQAARDGNANRLEYYRKETANYFSQAETALARLHGQDAAQTARSDYLSIKTAILHALPRRPDDP